MAELEESRAAVLRFLDSKYDLLPVFDNIKEFRFDAWVEDDIYPANVVRV